MGDTPYSKSRLNTTKSDITHFQAPSLKTLVDIAKLRDNYSLNSIQPFSCLPVLLLIRKREAGLEYHVKWERNAYHTPK